MINFFRKTRKKLADDNRPLKYMRYAIGEIVLVVVGILIALSINNWNEERIRDDLTRVYLKNVVDDLKGDIETMKILKVNETFKYYAIRHLLYNLGDSLFDSQEHDRLDIPSFESNTIWKSEIPIAFNQEFTQLTIIWMHRLTDQNLNDSAINELKNTGNFSHIRNSELKNKINKYYKSWEQWLGPTHQKINQDLRLRWDNSLGDKGIIYSNFFEIDNPMIVLKQDKSILNIARFISIESGYTAAQAALVIDEANSLIGIIEEAL